MSKDWIEAGMGSGDTWKPENEGDTIVGKYIVKKENIGLNNSNIYILQVEGKDEPTSVWGSSVLDTKFEEIPLKAKVKIEYLGREKGKGPQPYKNFKVLYKADESDELTKSVLDVFDN